LRKEFTMIARWCALSCLLLALCLVGCNNSNLIHARGKIVKGGQPYRTEEGQGLRIFFVPLGAADKHYESFAAEYNPEDGSFRVVGKDGKGLPPGKYRVDLQLMENKEDLLGGKLLGPKSPFTVEVTPSSSDVVIDLDQAKFDSLLEAAKPKKSKKG
jgi:hypothetical protein